MSAEQERDGASYQLCFRAYSANAVLAFPCNATGNVNLDALSGRERNDYLFARALSGRDFTRPVVEAGETPQGK